MSFKDDIKPYFQTHDYPTQAQFYEMFDKLRWKDEPLSITEITNLVNIINGLANPVEVFTKDSDASVVFIYTLPVGYILETVIIEPVANCTVRLTYGGEELAAEEIAADGFAVIDVKQYAKNAQKLISLNNVPSNTIIRFIKRKVTI